MVENIDDHAFDFDCLPDAVAKSTHPRVPLTSLLVSLTRGGGSKATKARSSHNRLYVGVHDNGVSLPSTVRNRDRLGGLKDSVEIVSRLLENTITAEGRAPLRELGYPELILLGEKARSFGWGITLQVVTQLEDLPKDAIIVTRTLPPLHGVQKSPKTSAVTLTGVPFVGTSVGITISVPGQTDWLN